MAQRFAGFHDAHDGCVDLILTVLHDLRASDWLHREAVRGTMAD